jgi:hypothetical protein
MKDKENGPRRARPRSVGAGSRRLPKIAVEPGVPSFLVPKVTVGFALFHWQEVSNVLIWNRFLIADPGSAAFLEISGLRFRNLPPE